MTDGNGERPAGPGIESDAPSIDPGAITPEPDDLYHALSERDRRRTLYGLLDEPRRTREEVADLIAGMRATQNGVVRRTDRQRIETRLHHVHLPLLEDAGLIEYDHDTGVVRLVPLADCVEDLIEFADEYDEIRSGTSR